MVTLAISGRPGQAQGVVEAVESDEENAVAHEANEARRYASLGMLIAAGAGAAMSIVLQPGGKQDVPSWQLASLGTLFGFAATWGTSVGYYRAGQWGYATLSGLGKTALVAGGSRSMELLPAVVHRKGPIAGVCL